MGIKRRILGTDIANLREMLCISLQDMLWLTGSFTPKWKFKEPELNEKKIAKLEAEIEHLRNKVNEEKEIGLLEHNEELDEILEVINEKQSAIFDEEARHKNEIDSPALSIMVRLLMEYPSLNILPMYPTPKETYDLIDAYYPHNDSRYEKYNVRRFSQIMGVSDWAGYNWIDQGKSANPVHKRLFLMLRTLIEGNDYVEGLGTEGLIQYMNIVDQEIKARGMSGGFPELNQEGGWKGKSLNRQSVVKERLKDFNENNEKISA